MLCRLIEIIYFFDAQQAALLGGNDGHRPVGHFQLFQNVMHMVLDSCHTDDELPRNLAVRMAVREASQQLALVSSYRLSNNPVAGTLERAAAESVLGYLSGCEIFADKGFIGDDLLVDNKHARSRRLG